tara:strand:- start:6929 stop:7795 length:867 start_codon:yes stop_codon:yes gene_type:complete
MLGEIIAMIVGGVATSAIKEELGLNPKSIGSGTGAGTQAGPEMEYTPVEGSERSDISEFKWQDPNTEASDSMNEEELMALLSQQDLSQQGIMGAAIGGYLKRDNGGSIKIPNVAITPNIPPPTLDPRVPPEMNLFGKTLTAMENMPSHIAEWYDSLDTETKNIIKDSLTDIGINLGKKAVGLGGRTSYGAPPAAGNANRRRQIQVNLPKGSQITSYAGGGALNRPMFMPHGGAMRGPGGPKEDLIPVMASNGEYMLSKAAVDQAGGGNHRLGIAKLNAFNNRGNRRYG